jgi:hypothetical protein
MRMLKVTLAATALAIVSLSAAAAEVTMTDSQLRAVVRANKVITLGGPTEDYIGALVLRGSTSGTSRLVFFRAGSWNYASGTWSVENGKFCRTYASIVNPGQTVCETWKYTSANSAAVYSGATRIGTNSW